MSDKQHLGPGSTKGRLEAAIEWNAVIERQSGKHRRAEDTRDRRRELAGAAAGSEVPDLDTDSAGDRGC